MDRGERRHAPEEYTIPLSRFRVHVKPVNSFGFIWGANEIINGEAEVPLNKIWKAYGAGPCVAGLAIVEHTPHIFHYTPDQFYGRAPLLANASGGIIGGSVDRFRLAQPGANLSSFVKLDEGVVSVLVKHKPGNLLDFLYMVT